MAKPTQSDARRNVSRATLARFAGRDESPGLWPTAQPVKRPPIAIGRRSNDALTEPLLHPCAAGREGQAIDGATEHFVEETRISGAPRAAGYYFKSWRVTPRPRSSAR
jgi:hypothetical protein